MEELSPDETEAVRRLLAEARHDEPMPADLAARLEDVLAGLVAEREEAEEPAPATVVPLRRRRRWPQVLVAAAAVSVLGYATTTAVLDSGTSGDAGSTAETTSDNSAEDFGGGAEPDVEAGAPQSPGPTSGPLKDALGEIDVRRLERLREATLPQQLDQLLSTRTYATDSTTISAACGPIYEVEDATRYVALYRSHVALVLAFPTRDGVRRVDVYDCESATPRRAVETVTLPRE